MFTCQGPHVALGPACSSNERLPWRRWRETRKERQAAAVATNEAKIMAILRVLGNISILLTKMSCHRGLVPNQV